MTTIPEARQVAGRVSPAASGPAARTLLLTGLGALSFSLLMLVAMDISTNPDDAGASGLQDLGEGWWQFNWKTDKAWTGTCRVLSIDLAGGESTTLQFTLR